MLPPRWRPAMRGVSAVFPHVIAEPAILSKLEELSRFNCFTKTILCGLHLTAPVNPRVPKISFEVAFDVMLIFWWFYKR